MNAITFVTRTQQLRAGHLNDPPRAGHLIDPLRAGHLIDPLRAGHLIDPLRAGHFSDPVKVAAFLILALLPLPFTGCGGITASGRNAEGVKLFQQSQYDQALRSFQEASYADGGNADAYYNQAATYHRLGKMNNNAQGDLQKAETYYNLCLDRNNNHADCYRGLAVLLAEEGRTQECFRLVEGWVSQQPTSADAKIELARLCEEFGDRNSAKEHLVEALTIQPDNPRALAALGKIREDSGDPAQALANYQRSFWYDNHQPQVASRISALQGSTNPSIVSTAPYLLAPPYIPAATGVPPTFDQSQMVNRDPAPLR
ncbi:MAG: tetratricopeptide repeat protein [Thermoguttaceae bacterium]